MISNMENLLQGDQRDFLKNLRLTIDPSEFEPEITASPTQAGARIWSVPIGYSCRTYDEGKHGNWRDRFYALCLVSMFPLHRIGDDLVRGSRCCCRGGGKNIGVQPDLRLHADVTNKYQSDVEHRSHVGDPWTRIDGTSFEIKQSNRDEHMYRGLKVIAMAPVLNEREKISDVVTRVPGDVVDEVLVVDDGSSDGSPDVARSLGATVIELGRTIGVGAAIRTGYEYAIECGYDVAVVMAGNNKDSPEEIPLLLDPIADDRADLVQGSRWLTGSEDFGAMPLYRRFATRLHPAIFRLVTNTNLTDTTNGFRAVKTAVLSDPELTLDQRWLDEYELEVYLLYKAAKLGYRVEEVGVTKKYPPKSLGQTKMRPITGWWSILRPLVLVGLHIKD